MVFQDLELGMAADKQTSYWRRFCQSVDGKTSSRQLAAGVALGMWIGLIPKDSLLFVLFTVLLILSPANLFSGFVSCVVCSWLGSLELFQSALQSVGVAVFETESFASRFENWFSTPLFPWFQLEKSLVLGALICGFLLFMPVYLIALRMFERFGDPVYSRLRNSLLCRWLVGERKTKISEGQA